MSVEIRGRLCIAGEGQGQWTGLRESLADGTYLKCFHYATKSVIKIFSKFHTVAPIKTDES